MILACVILIGLALAATLAVATDDAPPQEPDGPAAARPPSEGDHGDLPAAAGPMSYQWGPLDLAPPSWEQEVHVDLDTRRIEVDNPIRGDDFYYRYQERASGPYPTLTIRKATSLAVTGDPPLTGNECLRALQGETVEQRHRLAAGQHLCVLTDRGLIVHIDVRAIAPDGAVTLVATAWAGEPQTP